MAAGTLDQVVGDVSSGLAWRKTISDPVSQGGSFLVDFVVGFGAGAVGATSYRRNHFPEETTFAKIGEVVSGAEFPFEVLGEPRVTTAIRAIRNP